MQVCAKRQGVDAILRSSVSRGYRQNIAKLDEEIDDIILKINKEEDVFKATLTIAKTEVKRLETLEDEDEDECEDSIAEIEESPVNSLSPVQHRVLQEINHFPQNQGLAANQSKEEIEVPKNTQKYNKISSSASNKV